MEPTVGPQTIPQRASWWQRFATYGWNITPSTVEERELIRRSGVVAWIILGLICCALILIPLAVDDRGTFVAFVVFVLFLILAFVLNRAGLVSWAGGVLVFSLMCAVVLGIAVPGALATDVLPGFDLLVVPLAIGAFALPRIWAFINMTLAMIIVSLLYFLLPHTSDLSVDVTAYPSPAFAVATFLGRPFVIYVTLAFISFLWVGSTDRAIRRADVADEVAARERRLRENETAFADRQEAEALWLDDFMRAVADCLARRANGEHAYVQLRRGSPFGSDALRANGVFRTLDKQQQEGQLQTRQLARALGEYTRVVNSLRTKQSPITRLDPSFYGSYGFPELDVLQWEIFALLRPESHAVADAADQHMNAFLASQEANPSRRYQRPAGGSQFADGSPTPTPQSGNGRPILPEAQLPLGNFRQQRSPEGPSSFTGSADGTELRYPPLS